VTVVAAGSSMPSHLGRRALPGETLTSGPASSSWLSRKDAVAGAAESAWDVTGAPQPSRSKTLPDAEPPMPAAPADVAHVVADVVVAETVVEAAAAPSRRRRRGLADGKTDESTKEARPSSVGNSPGNARRVYLLAAIVVALLAAVAMMIL
jgi:hypothetical protein